MGRCRATSGCSTLTAGRSRHCSAFAPSRGALTRRSAARSTPCSGRRVKRRRSRLGSLTGHWIVLPDANRLGAALIARMTRAGATVTVVEARSADDGTAPAIAAACADIVRHAGAAFRGVVHLCGLDSSGAAAPTPQALEQTTRTFLDVVGGLLRGSAPSARLFSSRAARRRPAVKAWRVSIKRRSGRWPVPLPSSTRATARCASISMRLAIHRKWSASSS